MDPRERRGIEKTVFTDRETGREIWRLTQSDVYADRHAYYDVNPWSPDGRYIVFSSAVDAQVTTPVRDLLSTTDGHVYLMDANTFEIRYLAGEAFYQTHNGAFAVWHPSGRSVFYNHASGKVAAVDIETGETRLLEGAMRQISPDGTTIVWTENHQRPLGERGVYLMDVDGGSRRQIVRSEDVYALTPNKHLFPADDISVGNTKWTPDSQHILFTIWVGLHRHPGVFDQPGVQRSLYVVDRDGSNLRWLTHFGHHHSWTPDGSAVLYCDWLDPDTKKEPRLFLIDADGTNRRVVIDGPLGGHPLMSPDGTMVTTWDDHGVIVVHVPEQMSEYVATFGDGFDSHSHRGTHPHPVWRQDGSQLLYNSAQFGRSQICVVPMVAR